MTEDYIQKFLVARVLNSIWYLRLMAGCGRGNTNEKPLDIIPLVNIGTIMVYKLSSVTAFFTLK